MNRITAARTLEPVAPGAPLTGLELRLAHALRNMLRMRPPFATPRAWATSYDAAHAEGLRALESAGLAP